MFSKMRLKMRVLIILFLALLVASCEQSFEEEPANNPEAIFENIWNTFNEEYAPFDERNVNWQEVYDDFRPLVSSNSSEEELYQTIATMLSVLDDGHVTLTVPGKEIYNSNRIRREKIDDELFNLELVKTEYLEPGYSYEEDSYLYGKIKGRNIGYIHFSNVGPNFYEMNDFLDKFSDSERLIIDLRHNDGGDFTYCFSEIGRLVDKRRLIFSSRTKNGTGVNDYTDWYEWHIEPSGDFINVPVMVLTDRYTISAGERAVMAFMAMPNVKVLGDTTSGAHGTMIGRELANGWFYSLVPQKVLMPDGNSYEGIGLSPDVYSKNTVQEIEAGLDKTLEVAIKSQR